MSTFSTPSHVPLTPTSTGTLMTPERHLTPLNLKRKVLIIGTGGTIASEPTANGYTPLRNDTFYRRLRGHPQLTDPTHGVSPSFEDPVRLTQVGVNTLYEELVTPPLDERGMRVGYEILDLDKHMDSSEMTPAGEPF
jgi:lysophospholipase